MKKSQHTPGPWEVVSLEDDSRFSKGWRSIIAGKAFVIWPSSYTTTRFGDTQEIIGSEISEPDARLIAAAPELLEALRQTLFHLEALRGTGEVIDMARAAIAKARGEVA